MSCNTIRNMKHNHKIVLCAFNDIGDSCVHFEQLLDRVSIDLKDGSKLWGAKTSRLRALVKDIIRRSDELEFTISRKCIRFKKGG